MGEEVIRVVGSHLVVECMRHGASPTDACRMAIERIVKYNGGIYKDMQVGFLAINKRGEYGAYALQKGFTYAVKNNDVETTFAAKSYY
jgi:N4-(beta-N-acetylglucosaminyl)-L-asparaginase